MAELGQHTVDFSTLVSRAAEESFLSLKEPVDKSKSSELSDTEKKIGLLKFINKTQQRMLRLNVLAKWCQQVPLIQYCQQLGSTLSNHDMCFSQAADSLFFMHEGLQQARAPVYDVPSAVEVLLTGSYQRLPKCVEDLGNQSSLNEEQQKPALRKLDMLVRSKLLEASLPKEITEVKVSNGTTLLVVDGEFKVLVTLGYRGHLSMWRILHLELLVGERTGPVKLEQSRRHILGDDLERRMSVAENPFATLYSVLHELCVAIAMDTVIRQVKTLRLGRWKDAIRFELISDGSSAGSTSTSLTQDGESDSAGLRTPGLKILYWLEFEKSSGSSDSGSCPYIKLEPGPDLQIRCHHSSFVVDPETGKEANFSLDQSCIDIEKLLLRAISCNIHTRLLEIQKELVKNGQICRAAGDVVLQAPTEAVVSGYGKNDHRFNNKEVEGQEVLRVRAYGSSFFTLGINIRNGHFLLQSSQNILSPSALLDCEEAMNQGNMTAGEVFMSLRRKSILHMFAAIARFLGLEVYEHGSSASKVPKNLLNGSEVLLMGFPSCGGSYLLLLELDKDFKPLFKLLETQYPSGTVPSISDLSHVTRIKKIDISQMQIFEDETSLCILNWRKVIGMVPNSGGANQAPERGLLSDFNIGSSIHSTGCPSSFMSVVDEIFELEKRAPAPSFSSHNQLSTYGVSSGSHFSTVPMNIQNTKAGTASPKWEGGLQASQLNNVTKVSSPATLYGNSLYSSGSLRRSMQSSSFSLLASGQGKSLPANMLTMSKSEQDLASLRSPHSNEVGVIDEDHLRLSSDSSKDPLSATRSARLLSPSRSNVTRVSGSRSSSSGNMTGTFRVSGSSPLSSPPLPQAADNTVNHMVTDDVAPERDRNCRKRTISDVLSLIPSLQGVSTTEGPYKRRKTLESSNLSVSPNAPSSPDLGSKSEAYSYGSLLAEANKGNAPPSIYVSALLHVVRHGSLCIKHARLTSQMEAMDIPFVEEVGLRNASSNIWFRLPSARDDSWQHICLRLGRPGSMYWDVKINDQHFRDLWELQKGNNSTPWGAGVRIANTSDVDSHVHFDPEGVVLSYDSVEVDSIKKLVADIRRLSNARMFALGMRKLLGVRADDKSEDGAKNSDIKLPGASKGVAEAADKLSEQMRRAFKIESVGLLSFWFSFGSAVLARFVVEWEPGKEGCTMHVSPDQLWPHTKFLEDFINGAEVASLLDCIRLTAGPLHALSAATRPARAGPAPVAPVAVSGLSSTSKQLQGLLTSSSTTNTSQAGPVSGGNPVTTSSTGSLGNNNNIHAAGMLVAAGRGGPGMVPSSLLPIDVSVVLRGPYWIRIVYRKHFAVDMRCFAGDQVWLQPATPPKGGSSVGGSLPCPQFRPFIMEHVAQELNGLDSNLTGGQPTVGAANGNIPNSNPGQLSANGNRVGLATSTPTSRTANQSAGLNRVGNGVSVTSNLAVVSSGLPVRRTPGTVPALVRGELNTAIIALGDDGGYGGGWVPLVALKKVLRGILKYLGVLWLFAQLPDLLKEILGSILKDNEGALLNLDQEQPALRFFIGGYVFAVSVHRVQLLLQVLSINLFNQQQQQQQPNSAQEELSPSEIVEICDYFSRRVASEPYDASRVASFITLLTLPISVLREFLKLIAWKKSQTQSGELAPAQRPRIELCLENHAGLNPDDSSESLLTSKSNIHYNRSHNSVDFALTVVLDPAHIPHINSAGGAAWLPYCVSVRLRYSFGENQNITFLGMEGSHGGRACWLRVDEWEKCKQRVARTVEGSSCGGGDPSQGKLRTVADNVQKALHFCLQGLRDSVGGSSAV